MKKLMALLEWVWKFLRIAFKRFLRFFNLLEPDVPYMVLSLSKVSMWLTLGLTVYVMTKESTPVEVTGALLTNMAAIGNYVYRRHVQVKTQKGAYGEVTEDPA